MRRLPFCLAILLLAIGLNLFRLLFQPYRRAYAK